MIRQALYIAISGIFLFSFSQKQESAGKEGNGSLKPGIWKGNLMADEAIIPFTFEVKHQADSSYINLINGEERFAISDLIVEKDSVHIPIYIFDAAIHAKIVGDSLKGVYVKNYAVNYRVPFTAVYGDTLRFGKVTSPASVDFSGNWEVDFIAEQENEKAIGIFDQRGSYITGTFATSTGDYRFLEGAVDGNTMKLSTFDGTHAYLFEAVLNDNGEIQGDFWSGKSFHQPWTARRNPNFQLPDPYSITKLNPGYDEFRISFPDAEGNIVSLDDNRFAEKVVVIQILGSWCPNCMDESRFLVDWYSKNASRGVEIVGLAFERKPEPDYARERVRTMREKLGITYPVLIAGTTKPESRAEALPMLNNAWSFPTTIILDRKHKVREIHTGFSGPGTGELYVQYVEEFNMFMNKLIAE